jgi:nitroreductase
VWRRFLALLGSFPGWHGMPLSLEGPEFRLPIVEVEEAIRRLRVVRRFSDQPVSEEDVHALLEAGRRTGSSKNDQAWHFILVRDRELLTNLADVGAYAGHIAGANVAIALLTPDPEHSEAAYSLMWDLGRAAQNMVLAAWARGIGSAPATVYDQTLCRQLLGYPVDWFCGYILSFGHPANPEALTRPLKAGGRRPLAEIISRDSWSEGDRQ